MRAYHIIIISRKTNKYTIRDCNSERDDTIIAATVCLTYRNALTRRIILKRTRYIQDG